jgi:hypothetical protein
MVVTARGVPTGHPSGGAGPARRRRSSSSSRGGDTVDGSGEPRLGLTGQAEASTGASVAVFDPLALFAFRVAGGRGGGAADAGGRRSTGLRTPPDFLRSAASATAATSSLSFASSKPSNQSSSRVTGGWSCCGLPALRLCNSSVCVRVGGWGRFRFHCSHARRLRDKITSVNFEIPKPSAARISARSSGSLNFTVRAKQLYQTVQNIMVVDSIGLC